VKGKPSLPPVPSSEEVCALSARGRLFVASLLMAGVTGSRADSAACVREEAGKHMPKIGIVDTARLQLGHFRHCLGFCANNPLEKQLGWMA